MTTTAVVVVVVPHHHTHPFCEYIKMTMMMATRDATTTITDSITGVDDDDEEVVVEMIAEGAILQIRGKFPFGLTSSTVYVSSLKDELQKAFDSRVNKHATTTTTTTTIQLGVVSVFSERNFNHIQHRVVNSNSLFEEDEIFVKLRTPEQALYVLRAVDNVIINITCSSSSTSSRQQQQQCIVRFSAPSYESQVRSTYRNIGQLVKRLNYIDNELKTIGAVSCMSGVPVLPGKFVHLDEFDLAVKTLLLLQQQQNDDGSKHVLHEYMVSRIRVDRRKMESVFDSLVDERIDTLLKLCGYDQFGTPFSFTREFV